MRTLLIVLLALGLHTASQAQTSTLLATRTDVATATAPAPDSRAEARTTITELVNAELQKPATQKYGPQLVYVDLNGSAATVRVQYEKARPVRVYYYHLLETNGQWRIVTRDTNSKVQL